MSDPSKFISVVFLFLFGRRAIHQRDYERGGNFLRAALEEKNFTADKLAGRLRIKPADIPSKLLDSLVHEAAERAATKEADGIARWRSLFPEVMNMADAVDDYLRGQKVRDDRARRVLEFHRL